MKKRVSIRIVSLLLIACYIGSVQAFALESVPTINEQEKSIDSRAEEVEWVFRDYNGQMQRRLWSYTEGKWLTEWENC